MEITVDKDEIIRIVLKHFQVEEYTEIRSSNGNLLGLKLKKDI